MSVLRSVPTLQRGSLMRWLPFIASLHALCASFVNECLAVCSHVATRVSDEGISDRPHVPVMHVFSEKIIGPRKAYVMDIFIYPFYISESPIT